MGEDKDQDYKDIINLRSALIGCGFKEEQFANDDFSEANSNSFLDFDEIKVDENLSPELCRKMCWAYCKTLQTVEKVLEAKLEECEADMSNIKGCIVAAADKRHVLSNNCNKGSVLKNNWYYMFGAPYFKTQDYFPCSYNEDKLKKKANKELNICYLRTSKPWKMSSKSTLEEAVKSEEIEKQVKTAQDKGFSQDEINIINKKSLAELVGSCKTEYDWMKISRQAMEGDFSPEQCRAMWFNYLHPMIKKTKWTAEEDEKLIELVGLYNSQNWDLIAEELGTNRSGYQCICHYQTKLNGCLKKGKWTEEEDEYLREIVDSCRIGTFIPWEKVTSYMDGRNKNQVFCRWSYTLDPNIKRGRFTKEEDLIIVAAVRRHGTDSFQRIASFLPGRTTIQVRDRYYLKLKSHTTGEAWTPDENATLMALVHKYGEGNWSKISKHFHNRSRVQVRQRFGVIKDWMSKQKNYDGELAVPTRKGNIHNVQSKRKSDILKKALLLLHSGASSQEISDLSLMMLQENLNLQQKRRGRRVGQKKVKTELDKEYYRFFRCVYAQSGGRKKKHFSDKLTQEMTEDFEIMLQLFKANLKIPETDADILEDHILDDSDKVLLRNIRSSTEAGTGVGQDTTVVSGPGTSSVAESPECEVNVSSNITGQDENTYGRNLSLANNNLLTTYEETSRRTKKRRVVNTAHSTSESLPSCSLTDSSKLCYINSRNSTVNIPYCCPPNHATLVGFRSTLLNRRNLHGNIISVPHNGSFDFPESGDASSSSEITFSSAADLWNERFFSLFTWPAIMSNIEPVFPDAKSETDEDASFQVVKPPKKMYKGKVSRKRKYKGIGEKKKKATPPAKKRKYERTGKYKKDVPTTAEVRRSMRQSVKPTTES